MNRKTAVRGIGQRPAHLGRAVGLVVLVVGQVVGCTVTVDLDYLGDGQCPSGEKLCSGECVFARNPATGCGDSSRCTPCILLNATANCSAGGACAIAACVGSYRDCNGEPSDGCEIDADHDPDFCGGCEAAPCEVDNATPDCAAGRCAIRSCNEGFGDCNNRASDGCETDLTQSSQHCSACGQACLPAEACVDGVCQ